MGFSCKFSLKPIHWQVKGDPTKSLKAFNATHLRTTPVAFGRTTFSPQRKTRISATLRYTSVGEVWGTILCLIFGYFVWDLFVWKWVHPQLISNYRYFNWGNIWLTNGFKGIPYVQTICRPHNLKISDQNILNRGTYVCTELYVYILITPGSSIATFYFAGFEICSLPKFP